MRSLPPGGRQAGRSDWVRAGQALQRVLLTATWLDLATTPISQAVEVASVRRVLAASDGRRFPQMVLRVGYGKAAGRTPRRPLSEVLLSEREEAAFVTPLKAVR